MNDLELDQLLGVVTPPSPPPSMRRGLVAALPAPRRTVFGLSMAWVVLGAGSALLAVLGAEALNPSPVLGEFHGAVEMQQAQGQTPLYAISTRMIDPPAAALHWWFLGSANSFGGTLQLLDGSGALHIRSAGVYYGYQYTLSQISEGQYQATFAPLSPSAMAPYKLKGQILPPPSLPAPMVVRFDQPFDVTVYQANGERIYDRIVITWTAPPKPAWQSGPLRPGVMRLTDSQLFVNGQLAFSQHGSASGAVIWAHLPGQGRFLVAVDPQANPRFTPAGHVDGKVIEFQSEGMVFRIVCSKTITAGGDHPVYVYHQQSFENEIDPSTPMARQAYLGSAGPASLHQ